MTFVTVRDTRSSEGGESHYSRYGFIALLAVASLVATPPGIALAANDSSSASEEQRNGESEKAAQEKDKKQGFWDRFKDPKDGKLDLTAGGEQGEGFFPIAMPFNEPATGAGLAVALAYFHPRKDGATSTTGGAAGPPTATFGAVAGTTNGSWFVAGGHHHVWKDDNIRYLGAVGGGSINLTFFGFGDGNTSEEDGRDFNIKVTTLVQQAKFRLADSPVFIGVKYIFAATNTTFDIEPEGSDAGKANLASLAGLAEYDTRDTVFTPNSGLRATLDLSWFSEALGGDFDYGSVKTKVRYYWPLGEHWVLGFRADFDAVGDDAPFFALPFVKLRGVPIFRYLGNYVVTFEVEPRYKIDERWSVVGFTGVGRAATELSNLADADKVYNFGTGFRYLIARKLGLGIGIDIARGPEDTVGYLTVGSAW